MYNAHFRGKKEQYMDAMIQADTAVCLIKKKKLCANVSMFTFSHLADAFIQSDLQMRTIEAIKINKRAMICKCYNNSQLA